MSSRSRHIRYTPRALDSKRVLARRWLVGWSRSTPLPNGYMVGPVAYRNDLRFGGKI